MVSRRNSRSPTSKDNCTSLELQFCCESGQTYRPFTDPKRIETNDAKKAIACDARARIKGVPDAFLGILQASPCSRPQLPSATSTNQSETSTFNDSIDIPTSSTSPGRPDVYAYDSSYLCGFDPFGFGRYSLASDEQGTDTCLEILQPYSTLIFSETCGDDHNSLDLDGPVVYSESLETAATLCLDDMNLGFLHSDTDHLNELFAIPYSYIHL